MGWMELPELILEFRSGGFPTLRPADIEAISPFILPNPSRIA
jgi:hypothetical protein